MTSAPPRPALLKFARSLLQTAGISQAEAEREMRAFDKLTANTMLADSEDACDYVADNIPNLMELVRVRRKTSGRKSIFNMQ